MRIGRGGGNMSRRSVGRTTVSNARRVGVYGSSSSGSQQDPFSSSTLTHKPKSSTSSSASTPLSLSSPPHNNKNHFPSIWHSFTYTNTIDDDSEWVSVDATEHVPGGRFTGFGPAPSETEVDDAVASLQQVLGPASRVQLLSGQVSEDEPETDWVEPSLFPYNSKGLQANGSDRVYYAIHLLQTDPSVQRIVKSLSTDEAVWEAVLNNEVVQELRESISAEQEHLLQSLERTGNDDGAPNTPNVVMLVLNSARAKFMEVVEKITKIVIDLFQHAFNKTAALTEESEPFNEKLRTSFMLSIMVLLIVVVSRVQS